MRGPPLPIQVPGVIKKASCGNDHIMFLTETGEVYVYGQNAFGSKRKITVPTKMDFPEETGPIEDVSCGTSYTLFLTDNGEAYECGVRLGVRLGDSFPTPKKVFGF
jgi:alpha-tubulin suppressor-like RCC1 family protein